MSDFEEIYIQYYEAVYQYVYSLCFNQEVAKDITSQTFFKAIENIGKFNYDCKIYVWLCQIAKNTYFTFYKKQKRQIPLDDCMLFSVNSETDMESALSDRESVSEIKAAIEKLENPYRQVFSLRIFSELPFADIGKHFGKSDSWARVIFYRAKTKIRSELNERM